MAVVAAGSGRSPGPLRRQAGGSARALLLTVLGEFVLPRGGPVWTAALVQALAAVGVEEKAARQALARAAAEGLLAPARVGRRTRWELTGHGRSLLEAGARRIYGFRPDERTWDGRWLVLSVTVPESRRQLRQRLRTRLTWAGLGSPAPGLWVLPDAGRAGEVAGILAELGIADGATAWVGKPAGIGRPRDLVAAAWAGLDELEAGYADFVAAFARRRPLPGVHTFAAQVELVQAWRRFPFLDPALPAGLLQRGWPGRRAATVFHRCHDRWQDAAQQYWRSLAENPDPAGR